MNILNLPNTLTIARIILIPVFVTAIIYNRYDYALYLFVTAALTDALDGLLARSRNQKTALGTFLDPLADKFLLVTSFILFAVYGFVPKWLTVTIISRDIIVVIGWLMLYLIAHTAKVEPLLSGKLAIAAQLVLISYMLLHLNFPRIPDLHKFLTPVTAVLTIVSGLHYIYRGIRQANAH